MCAHNSGICIKKSIVLHQNKWLLSTKWSKLYIHTHTCLSCLHKASPMELVKAGHLPLQYLVVEGAGIPWVTRRVRPDLLIR
uniref:Uncharacterized protein n=1 Tax=Pyxicephalus adspersus TaxID=30357 RepID=A0AAV3ANH3_PYXAD|nr:TPA: hypothetical protein GDO54_000737 [Pyxicephalus adspersus]